MPTIAQKLCRDIVEPGIKTSVETVRKRSSGKFSNISSRYNTKRPQSGNIAKTKISKFEPPPASGSSIKCPKSGVTVLKSKIADSAVNTLVSGPLRCDNNCVTSIRKRNHQGTCKCGQNRKFAKGSAKQIQTLCKVIYPVSDKACTQRVETASCGTQFLDNRERMLKQVSNLGRNIKTPIKLPDFKEKCSKDKPNFDKYNCLIINSKTNQSGGSRPSLRYISAKRWALTNYPTKGPDF